MIIANPIYDTVFKFLMEDLDSAKILISAIIGEEILELESRPQERTASSDKFLLTVFRVDFKAIVRTASGEQKKILIELQKSNHSFDLPRFRHYLGSNYSQIDEVDGVRMSLPLLPIYFLGFPLSIKYPVLKVGRAYQDVATGEILKVKDQFIEHLSHDCFVVQIKSLPPETRTRLEKLLSVFNQNFIFDADQRWLMNYSGDLDDAALRTLVKRLSLAAESPEVQERIKTEEDFDFSMEKALREKEEIIEAKELKIEEQEVKLEEQGAKLEEQTAKLEEQGAKLEEQTAKLSQSEKEKVALLEKIAALENQLKK